MLTFSWIWRGVYPPHLAQAGWHELRLKKAGSLELVSHGRCETLSLGERSIEKIAVGMMDFGSFQDRSMPEKFMEATSNVNFGSPDPSSDKKFMSIDGALQEIRDQYNAAHQGEAETRRPFFNCWFMSIPNSSQSEGERIEKWLYQTADSSVRTITP